MFHLIIGGAVFTLTNDDVWRLVGAPAIVAYTLAAPVLARTVRVRAGAVLSERQAVQIGAY